MEFLKETRFIERLQFFNGQRLFASDLQGVEAFNREMRWLHNKSLHQPGIGNGFAVSGKKGDRNVIIGPGYAIDSMGREIVSTQEQVIEPVPPVAGGADGEPVLFDLTVSYPDDADLEETERREGICKQSGTIRLKEEPVFCWVRLNEDGHPIEEKTKQDILTGLRIVLARAEVLNCRLNKDISIAQRLSARPPKQPFICCRMEEPAWQIWEVAPFDPAKLAASDEGKKTLGQFASAIRIVPVIFPIGLQAEINTADCGFLTTPCYQARISGSRVKSFTTGSEPGLSVSRRRTVTFLFDGLVQITDPRPDGFKVNVLLIGQALTSERSDDDSNLSDFKSGSFDFAAVAGDTSGNKVDEKLKEFIDRFFSDWKLEWMGVEG